MMWHFNGRTLQTNFGGYPKVSLKLARLKAEDLRRIIKEGADPTVGKRAQRQQTQITPQGIGSFGSILDTYFTTGS